MSTPTSLPSVEELHRLFSYDPVTGELRWRVRSDATGFWNTRYAGLVAGRKDHLGRIRVSLSSGHFRAHRIIFKMIHGTEPGVIDHINGNPADNRPSNLRAATVKENMRNRAPVRGRDLPKGVCVLPSKKFSAMIKVDGQSIYLGAFLSPADAHDAYRKAATTYFGKFARFE